MPPGVSNSLTGSEPQDNGRLERFHRTLKLETASPPRAHPMAQQRAFDRFRREYNDERPHEALGMRRPASLYRPSARRYPRPLERFVPTSISKAVASTGPVTSAGDGTSSSSARPSRTSTSRWSPT